MTDLDLEKAIAKEIEAFAALPDGWHFGDGIGAVAEAVQSALAVNELLARQGARNIEAFPLIEGGVLISGYGGRDTLEVRCQPDGRMDLAHEIADEEHYWQDAVSLNDIEAYLGGLAWLSPNLFVPCIPSISVRREDDFKVMLSNHLPEVGEYQFSRLPALWTRAAASATILLVSTVESFPLLMFSGELVQASSPQIVGLPTSHHRLAMPVTGTFMISEEAAESP